MLNKNEIRQRLRGTHFGEKIYTFETIESTNTFARTLNDAEEGTLVIAEEQIAGKGRQGRTWISEKGRNLTFSVLVKPNNFQKVAGLLPLCAGLAVVEAINSCTDINAECKWPNDVLIEGKKVCGILCESFSQQGKTVVVIGIGINVNQSSFPKELNYQATSLSLVLKKEIDRLELLGNVLARLEHWYKELIGKNSQKIVNEWKKNTSMLGRNISIVQGNQSISGVAVDLADDGGLLLQTNGKLKKILSGDVHLIH